MEENELVVELKSTTVATQVLHEVQWVIQESSVLLTVQADQDSVSLQLCHVNDIQLLIDRKSVV